MPGVYDILHAALIALLLVTGLVPALACGRLRCFAGLLLLLFCLESLLSVLLRNSPLVEALRDAGIITALLALAAELQRRVRELDECN